MMKNMLFCILLLSVAGSCKFHRIAADEEIKIPEKYLIAESNQIDSVNSTPGQVNQTVQLQEWKVFFTDPLLLSLIDSALTTNFDVQIAFQQLQQSRAGIQYTKGIRLPDLGLNLAAGVRKFGDYTIDGVGNYDTQFSPNLNADQQLPNPVPDFYAGIQSTWEIDVWGKLKQKKKAALSRYLASEEGRNLVITNLIAEIADTYYALMLHDKELEIVKESLTLQENALNVSEAKKMSGKANELAVEIMRSNILELKSMLIGIEQDIIISENRMNMLLGRYPQQIERSAWKAETEITQNIAPGVPSDLLMNRPDVRKAFHNLDANNADLIVAKTAFYPQFQINANVGYQAFRAALTFDPASLAYGFFGNMVTPLLNRRALKAQLMESTANKRESYIQLEKTILSAFTEVYELLQKSDMLNEMQQLKSEQVVVLEKSIETSSDLFVSGRASYLEVINAQQSYLRTQIDLLQISKMKTQNQVLLYKSLGGGL